MNKEKITVDEHKTMLRYAAYSKELRTMTEDKERSGDSHGRTDDK